VRAPCTRASHRTHRRTSSPVDVGVAMAQFGAVRTVVLVPDYESGARAVCVSVCVVCTAVCSPFTAGHHKGFGFIEFEELSAAAVALSLPVIVNVCGGVQQHYLRRMSECDRTAVGLPYQGQRGVSGRRLPDGGAGASCVGVCVCALTSLR
jgi:hypothetical protein